MKERKKLRKKEKDQTNKLKNKHINTQKTKEQTSK